MTKVNIEKEDNYLVYSTDSRFIQSRQYIRLVDNIIYKRDDHLKSMVEEGIEYNIINPYTGESILHIAAKCGYIKIFDIFKNLDINQLDFDGNSPLSTAINYNNSEIAIELIEFGADVYWKSRDLKKRLMDLAIEKKNTHISEILENIYESDEIESDISSTDSSEREMLIINLLEMKNNDSYNKNLVRSENLNYLKTIFPR